jgi:hypothetical protein
MKQGKFSGSLMLFLKNKSGKNGFFRKVEACMMSFRLKIDKK